MVVVADRGSVLVLRPALPLTSIEQIEQSNQSEAAQEDDGQNRT